MTLAAPALVSSVMKHHQHNVPAIYRITCSIDGKVYIGQARRAHERWTSHQSCLVRGKHRNLPLQEAWDTFGPEAFTWEIVAQPIGPHDPEAMTHLEVEVLKSHPNAYNLMIPVQAYLGASKSTRARLSKRQLEIWSRPELKAKRVEGLRAKKADPVYQEAHRTAMLAFNATPEGKAIRSRIARESWEDPEKRKNLSEARKKMWADPAYREKQRLARQASWANPASRAKRLAGLKRGWDEMNPEDREKRVTAAAESQRREDVRQAQSERTKKRWDDGNGPRPRKAKA